MYIQDRKGDTAEAVSLIIKKPLALAIATAQKPIEFREFRTFYLKLFCDIEKVGKKENLKMRDIHYLHLHDYKNSFFLAVAIEAIDLMALLPENREYFAEHNCTEVDSFIDEAERNGYTAKSPETMWYFCMPVKAIINTNLDLTSAENILPLKNFSDAKFTK